MISVRLLAEGDLEEARRIFRVAFGTFIGVPKPEEFARDRDYFVRQRYDPSCALAAEVDGSLVGSNLATAWGAFGFFGPLSVRPDLWDRGVAKALIGPTLDLLAARGVREFGLYTFPQSAKHLALYQKFGFWARYLTAVLSRPAEPGGDLNGVLYSTLDAESRLRALSDCRALCDSIHPGLDPTFEIDMEQRLALGDTVLLYGDRLDGFAVCHCGEGTEAGADRCWIKFAAAKHDETKLNRLLDACAALAASKGLARLAAGVNMARREAYGAMLNLGFRTELQGIAMHRPDEAFYNRPGVFVLDDWR